MGGGDVKMKSILELHLLIARQSLTLSLPRDISFLQICPQDAPVQLFLNCLFYSRAYSLRPMLPLCVLDGRSRNPLYYYYYSS